MTARDLASEARHGRNFIFSILAAAKIAGSVPIPMSGKGGAPRHGAGRGPSFVSSEKGTLS
jgi:hypothetical protein